MLAGKMIKIHVDLFVDEYNKYVDIWRSHTNGTKSWQSNSQPVLLLLWNLFVTVWP